GAQASPRIVDPASARRAVENPAVLARDAELAALAAGPRPTELAARLEVIARDATLADVAQEWLLDRGLHALARMAPTPAARATVGRLASRAPIVYTRIDPDHGDRATPLYDAGATARFVLRTWNRNQARAIAELELAAGNTRSVDRYAAHAAEHARSPVLSGIADAFRAAPAPQLATQRSAGIAALAAGQRVDALVLILAERLADPELFGLVFDNADEETALAAVPAVARVLDAPAALGALTRASRRSDIGSAALLEIGRLAKEDPAARDALFDALADGARAPSAAAALAWLADPSVSAELGRRLALAKTEDTRRILVLALKLDADPAARAGLARFAQSGAGSPKLQREVRSWLAR
ncbi:MAG TPA: hypothetical protein VIW03_10450, partial [Anaeromyxobacter sp.]